MKPSDVYKFCPRCGSALAAENKSLLTCASCRFRFYINPTPCNGAIIENDKGEILLVKRKFAPLVGYWDLPGGFIEPGESFEESLKREVKEELTVEVEITGIVGVYADVYEYQGTDVPTLGIVASARVLKGNLTPKDDLTEYKFFPKNEVLKQKIAFEGIKSGLEDYLKIL